MDNQNTDAAQEYETIMIRASPQAIKLIRMKASRDGLRIPRAATELVMMGAKSDGFFVPENTSIANTITP